MVETKMQRNARLKAMRKKYGLGEFKKSRSSSVKTRKRRVISTMAKSKRRSTRSKSSMGGVVGTAAGVAGYIAFEAFVEPRLLAMLPPQINGAMINVAEIAAGAYLARKGGVLGNVGKAAVVINMYQLMLPLAARLR